MTRTSPELTPAEFNVMKVLWQLRKATVAEARAELARRYATDLAYTTVMTLLGRLATKGAVSVDRTREPFVYKAAHRRELVLRDRLRDFVHQVFDGEADALVLRLVEDESLSLDELRDIERRIEDPDRKGAGEAQGSGDGGAPAARPDDRRRKDRAP